MTPKPYSGPERTAEWLEREVVACASAYRECQDVLEIEKGAAKIALAEAARQIRSLEEQLEALREALMKIERSGDRERNQDGSLVTAQQIAREALDPARTT